VWRHGTQDSRLPQAIISAFSARVERALRTSEIRSNPNPSGRQPLQIYDIRAEANPLPLCIAQPSFGGPNGERKKARAQRVGKSSRPQYVETRWAEASDSAGVAPYPTFDVKAARFMLSPS
jgi:hypothetical protein